MIPCVREAVTTVVEIAGAGAITVGAGMHSTPLGFVVGGAFALALGYLGSRPPRPRARP